MSNTPKARAATSRLLYALLFLYAAIAGTYEIANSVSTTIGTFNLRDQVQAPFYLYGNLITSAESPAVQAGVAKGDTVLAMNHLPFTGQALWHRIRWYARPVDTVTLLVRKHNGTTLDAAIPLRGYPKWLVSGGPAGPDHRAGSDLYVADDPRHSAFLRGPRRLGCIFPTLRSQCLVHPDSSYASARVESRGIPVVDPGFATTLLVLASLGRIPGPGRFVSSGFAFPAAIAARQSISLAEWLVVAFTGAIAVAGFVSEYNVWWDLSLLPRVDAIDRFVDPVFV